MINLKPELAKRVKRTNIFPVFAVSFLLVMTSCNPSLRFASVKYDAAQINHLLDATDMAYLTIQNNSSDAGNYKEPFSLVSYARKVDDGFVDTAGYDLQPVKGLKAKTFRGKTILGNFTLTKLKLLEILTDPKTKQRNKDFAYLLFTPYRDKTNGYLYFDVQADNVVRGMGGTSSALYLRPCPPATWCRPK